MVVFTAHYNNKIGNKCGKSFLCVSVKAQYSPSVYAFPFER